MFGNHHRPKKKAVPIAVIDCETDPFLRLRHPRPFLWGFYDGEVFREFPTVQELMTFLGTQGELLIYAHNGGKFDYQYMVDFLEPFSEVLIINGRLAKFKIGQCEFRDSWNILPEKLARFDMDGDKKLDIDYAKLEAAVREQHMPEIRRYLRADCVTLWKAVDAFTTTYGRNLTLAGAAMNVWKEMCPEEQPESSEMFYDFNREFYYGGRVQCFDSGLIERDFYFTDINSAYPFAMMHNHPISTTYTMEKPAIGDPIITQSLYHVRARSRGALPWRENSESALYFYDDDTVRDHCVTGWEMAVGIETGTIDVVKIHSRIDFLKEMNFSEYVKHFYKLKKAAKKGSADYIFAKLFLNSLYGKYAADPSNYCNYGIIPTKFITPCENAPETKLGRNAGPWAHAGLLGPWAVMAGKDMETGENNATHSSYYNVATAASITGFVRAYLWRHICKVRAGGGAMLYCDTDSLAFTYPGAESSLPFALNDELGGWTLEGTFDRGGIAGKKLYAFRDKHIKTKDGKPKWKTASKGVRLKEDEIMAIAQGAELTYLNPVPCFSPLNKGAPKFIHRTVKRTHAAQGTQVAGSAPRKI